MHVVFMLIPMLHNTGRQQHGQILEQLATIAESGQLRPVRDETQYTLSQAIEAHARLQSGQAMGKVAIENNL